MPWTTPRVFVAGEVETASIFNTVMANLNFLKSGVYGSVPITANVGPTSATTELVLASAAAFTPDGTTPIEIMFNWYNVTQTVTTDLFLVRLYDGPTAGSGTQIGQWLLNSAANGGSGFLRYVYTPTAVSHTYTARLVRNIGTGTATLVAAAAQPAVISVAQAN